jgi:general secretion pathway protein H
VDSLPPEGARPCLGRPGAATQTPTVAHVVDVQPAPKPQRGFTLLELLVVIAIIAIGTVGVSLALRDPASERLDRDAQRLAMLLEAGRAQSRASGVPVRWLAANDGFVFQGLPPGALPAQWLDADTTARSATAAPLVLVLGPEPIIGPQAVLLSSASQPGRTLRVTTDGLRPFTVQPEAP